MEGLLQNINLGLLPLPKMARSIRDSSPLAGIIRLSVAFSPVSILLLTRIQVLPILRSLEKVYGPVSVIHFDAHMDTGAVEGRTDQDRITHGSYFTIAAEERLMTNTSIHAGIRSKMEVRSLSQSLISVLT